MAQRVRPILTRRLRAVARRGLRYGARRVDGLQGMRQRCLRRALQRRSVATARDLVILDGAALNVRVRLPHSPGRPPAGAELVLTSGLHQHRLALHLHTSGEHSLATGLLTLTGLRDRGTRRWLLGLRLSSADGKVSHHGVYGTPSAAQPGTTRAFDRCPTTGIGYVLGCSARGRTSLTLTPSRPCTQVTRVVTGWNGVTVSGRVIPADSVGPATVTMSHRGGTRLSLPVTIEGGRFHFTVPIEAIPPGQAKWQFTLTTGSGPALPIGRFLGDPPRPDKTIRYPARTLPVQAGRRINLQPAYSARGRLLLTCSVPGDPS